MKKAGIIFLMAFVMIIGVYPYSYAEEPSFALSTKFWSQYLDNNGAVIHDKPVFQSDLLISLPLGFYFDFWHSMGLDGTGLSTDLGDEIDYTLGWNGNLKGIGFDLGFSYLDFIDLFKMPKGDVLRPYAEINKEFKITEKNIITPYVRWDGSFPAGANSPKGGQWFSAGLKHIWQINEIAALQQKLFTLYDTGALGFEKAIIGQYHIGLGWSVAKSVTLELPNFKISTPFTSVNDGRKSEFVIGAGLSFRF